MKKIVLITSALFLVNCSQYAEPQGLSGRTTTKQSVADVNLEATFASIKTNIIDKKCLSCHKADSKSDAKDIPFETETQVVDGSSDLGALVVPGRPAESLLYKSIVGDESIRGKAKVMPPKDSPHPAVTPSEQHVVAAWIAGVVVKKTEPAVVAQPQAKQPDPALQKQQQQPADQSADKAQQPVPSTMSAPKAAEPTTLSPQVVADPTVNTVVPQAQIAIEPPPSAALPEVVDFTLLKTEVLEKKCMVCHKADGKADELVFSTRDELLALTNSFGQSFVIAGKPDQSIMYLSVIKDEDVRKDIRLMPPKKDVVAGKATDVTLKDVALINKWIADGAK